MATKTLQITATAALLLLSSISSIGNTQQAFDIMKYGAKADGVTGIDKVVI